MKVKLRSLLFFVGGIVVILLAYGFEDKFPHNFPWKESISEIGIASMVAGIIAVIFEEYQRFKEKKETERGLFEEIYSRIINPKLFKELKEEIILRKAYRTNMTMNIQLFEGRCTIDGHKKDIDIDEGQGVLKIIISYDLRSLVDGEHAVDVKTYLDHHMYNKSWGLPCFTYATIQHNIGPRNFRGSELAKNVTKGCLTLPKVKVSDKENDEAKITVERYEIVNIPGMYTLVLPEMVIPSGTNPTIKVIIENAEKIRKDLSLSVENWFSSENHKFEKDKLKNDWYFNNVILPGQGFSIIFSNENSQI